MAYSDYHGSYKEKILDSRWAMKRSEIVLRDQGKCVHCGSSDGITVHHTQYHWAKNTGTFVDPWDYDNKYLVTLCRACHEKVHANTKIPVKNINHMNFFSWGKKKHAQSSASDISSPKVEDSLLNVAVNNQEVESVTVVKPVTGRPIDELYSLLRADYEPRGLQDALQSPDLSYADRAKEYIKSDYELHFQQVLQKYADDQKIVEAQIYINERASMMDTVERLKSEMEILKDHIERITQMQQDLKEEKGCICGILMSYDRGFTRGIAARTEAMLNERK